MGPYGLLPASDKTRSVGLEVRIARSYSGVIRDNSNTRASSCSGDIGDLIFSRLLIFDILSSFDIEAGGLTALDLGLDGRAVLLGRLS